MRKFLHIIFAFMLIVSCAGCDSGVVEYRTEATFYYCAEELDFAPGSSVILSEGRTINAPSDDHKSIMQFYMAGPKSQGLRSPFPKDLTVKELIIDGEIECNKHGKAP